MSTLYVVATPIGNREDVTQRALQVLQSVDLIAVEDTRHSGPLLKMWGIGVPLISYHDHNENARTEQLLQKLAEGQNIALISDAGTPLISDPGYVLVRQCREQGFNVVPIPGVSAVITALSVAGLATDRFTFEGFCPRTTSKRQQLFDQLNDEKRTMIFYESSHRILQTLDDMQSVWGDEREIVIARELTKLHETILFGHIATVKSQCLSDKNQQKGEFVIVVSGATNIVDEEVTAQQTILMEQLINDLATSRIASIMVATFGGNKKGWYQRVQRLKDSQVSSLK